MKERKRAFPFLLSFFFMRQTKGEREMGGEEGWENSTFIYSFTKDNRGGKKGKGEGETSVENHYFYVPTTIAKWRRNKKKREKKKKGKKGEGRIGEGFFFPFPAIWIREKKRKRKRGGGGDDRGNVSARPTTDRI